jgi:GH43 family beta-xylosidase
MYVLYNDSYDPQKPYTMYGKVVESADKWAIDQTVFSYNGELYTAWSGWEGDENVCQNIYLAKMSDPLHISTDRVMISTPEYDWEKVGEPHVNEGPTALQHNGRTFVTYSASGSWTDDYCLGLLTLVGNDPLNPAHWQKSATPVFAKVPGLTYGPGHNSFTTAADGSVWMVYHSNETAGAGWTGRSIWIAPVTFDANGNPRFGKPERTVNFPVAAE